MFVTNVSVFCFFSDEGKAAKGPVKGPVIISKSQRRKQKQAEKKSNQQIPYKRQKLEAKKSERIAYPPSSNTYQANRGIVGNPEYTPGATNFSSTATVAGGIGSFPSAGTGFFSNYFQSNDNVDLSNSNMTGNATVYQGTMPLYGFDGARRYFTS